MKDGPFPWSDFMVQLSWLDFLIINKFTKPLGPSLGVDRMWTKRNDHAPKMNVLDFFKMYMPKRVVLGENYKSRMTILLSSLVFVFSSP
jgi:hypothetical protein